MCKIKTINKKTKLENLIDFQLEVNKLLERSRKSLFRKYGAKKCQFAIENSDGDFLEDMDVYTRQRSMLDQMLKSQQKLYTGQISKKRLHTLLKYLFRNNDFKGKQNQSGYM